MLILRSLAFNLLFYLNLLAQMLVVLPTLLMPRQAILRVAQNWARTNFWLLARVAGIGVEFRGLDRLPKGPLIVACKHQSAWETFGLLPVLDDPAFILKRELLWVPLFGWYAWKAEMIPVDRGARSEALRAMTERARAEMARGRQIIIFPEGTRRPVGADPAYKFGVAHLYEALGVPCVPVALNSGLFWPRRTFLRRPGTIVVEVLEPIAPGLDATVALERLRDQIEGATARLLAEGRGSDGCPAAKGRDGALRHR